MIRLALLAFGALALAAGDAQAAWKPLPPSGDAVRVNLADETGRWTRLAPGETLAFPIPVAEEIRLRTRAVLRTEGPRRTFRLHVTLPDGTLRRLKRGADREGPRAVEGETPSVRREEVLTERDEWRSPLGGSGIVRVHLPNGESAPIYVRLLARGLPEKPGKRSTPASKSSPGLRFEIDGRAAAGGVDTNPYLSPSDVGEEQTEWFWPVALDLGVRGPRHHRIDWRFAYAFDGRFYDDPLLDERRHRLRAEQRLAFADAWSLRFSQRARAKDDTYFGRGELEERETASDVVAGASVSLGDRFDWVEGRVRVDVMRDGGGAWQGGGSLWWIRRDYDEDYDSEPDIYSLDQNRLGSEAWISRELSRRWTARLEAGLHVREYDEKFARDATGTVRRSATTHLRRWPVKLELSSRERRGPRFRAIGGWMRTEDLEAGYWNRDTFSGTVEIGWRAPKRTSVGFRLRRSVTDYESARLGYVETGQLREKDSWRLALDAARGLGEDWLLSLELRQDSLDNNSRDFAYDRGEAILALSWGRRSGGW